MQYSLPAAEQLTSGNARPDPPWPFDLVRPHLNPGDLNADALVLQGKINSTGSFEQLSVAFPPHFLQEKAVLEAIQKWQFRPATVQGTAVSVDILLINPEAPE